MELRPLRGDTRVTLESRVPSATRQCLEDLLQIRLTLLRLMPLRRLGTPQMGCQRRKREQRLLHLPHQQE